MKHTILLALALATGLLTAAPTVSNISLTVDPESPNVKVTYAVSEPAVITAKFFSNGVQVPEEQVTHLVGDVCRRVEATAAGEVRTFWWASDLEDWGSASHKLGRLRVELTAWVTTAPPMYMAVDLAVGTNVQFYASAAAVPGGVTSEIYKTEKMLFRKIPAKEVVWNMDCSSKTDNAQALNTHRVVLSDDYYIAVYPVTQGQSKRFCNEYRNGKARGDLLPVDYTSYSRLLGSDTAMAPSANSDIGKLAALSGIPSLNLPTEAQWEYACRALTSTMWYNSGAWGDAGKIMWASGNSGKTLQPVGEKLPNGFGLYDMAGNVFEFCLDWYSGYEFTDANTAVRDPLQTTQPSSNKRVRRGGNYSVDYRYGNSGWRTDVAYTSYDWGNGYRPVCAAVAY